MPGQPPNPSLVGSTIQNRNSSTPVVYQVSDWLRSTGVLDTYLAAHTSVAIKIELKHFNPVFTALNGFSERFAQNMKPLVTLNVSSVIKVYDYGSENGHYFMVVEYHKSPTLRARLDSERRLPLASAIDCARQIAETLDLAASIGVLHGLLVPESITMTSKRGALIGDIGLAPIFGDTLARVLAKSPQISTYAAPELVMGQPLTVAHDLYAVSSMLYEMVTGQVPYPNATPFQVSGLQVPNPAQFDPALSVLTAIIQRGLAKDPAARFHNYDEFQDALRIVTQPASVAQSPVLSAPAASIPPAPAPRTPTPPPAAAPKTEKIEDDFAGRTMADMPVFSAPPAPAPRTPTPPPPAAPKTEKIEDDFAGRTMADMPVFSAPPAPAPRTPTPPPAASKTEKIEDDFAGRTMADMPVFSAPPAPAPHTPTPPPAAAPKTETVEEDFAGRTMADMPVFSAPPAPAPRTPTPPPVADKPIVVVQPAAPGRPPNSSSNVSVPAAAKAAAKRAAPPAVSITPPPVSPPASPPKPPPVAAPVEPNFSARTMLEMPGMPSAGAPPVIPPSFNTAPPAAPAQSYGNSPRQLEQRYRTDRIDDPSTGPDSPYSMPTVPPGGAAPPNSVPYNFGSVPPTYSGGGAQMTTPRQLDQRYSTSVMNRADISGSGNGPSSGVTGFLSAYQGEKPAAAKRRSPVLLIVIVLLVLLILIAVGFVVLKASGALG